MTKRLEDLFDLPDDDESLSTPIVTEATVESAMIDHVEVKQTALSNLEKIERALTEVKELDNSDTELDDIADLAKESYNNLMDLGMQCDPRFASEIFNSGSSFLGHALSAKTAKINKKLKMIQLQLQKAELDRKTLAAQLKDAPAAGAATDLGQAHVIDRNELIKSILAQANSKDDKKDK